MRPPSRAGREEEWEEEIVRATRRSAAAHKTLKHDPTKRERGNECYRRPSLTSTSASIRERVGVQGGVQRTRSCTHSSSGDSHAQRPAQPRCPPRHGQRALDSTVCRPGHRPRPSSGRAPRQFRIIADAPADPPEWCSTGNRESGVGSSGMGNGARSSFPHSRFCPCNAHNSLSTIEQSAGGATKATCAPP